MSKSSKERPGKQWVEKIKRTMKINNISFHNQAAGAIKEKRRTSIHPYQHPNGLLSGAELIKRQRSEWNPAPYQFPDDSLARARLHGDLLEMLKKKSEYENRQRGEQELNLKKRKHDSFTNLPTDLYETVDLPDISLFKKPAGSVAIAPERTVKRMKQHRSKPYDNTLASLENTLDFRPPGASTPILGKSEVLQQKRFSPPQSPLHLFKKTHSAIKHGATCPQTFDFQAKQHNFVAVCNGVAISADRILFPRKKSILDITRTLLRKVEDIFKNELPVNLVTPSIVKERSRIKTRQMTKKYGQEKKNELQASNFTASKRIDNSDGFFDFFQREETEVKLIF